MAVTLKQLSQATGYSVATISRVLNHDPTMRVNEKTRCVIFDTAKKLGYTGGLGRRMQRAAKTMTIGIAEMHTPERKICDSYFLYLKSFVEQICHENSIQVVTLFEKDDAFYLTGKDALDGIIAIGYFSAKQIQSLEKISENITFLDSSPNEVLHDSVVLNLDLGMQQALDYLHQLGHRKIGYLSPQYLRNDIQRRIIEPKRKCYERFMRKFNLYRRELIVDIPWEDQDAAAETIRYAFQTMNPDGLPTALLVTNSECTIAAIQALYRLHLSIPQNMSIIGFHDIVIASAIEPPLTSINPHLEYMAATAVQLVTERAATAVHPRMYPQKVIIPPTLVKRASTVEYRE